MNEDQIEKAALEIMGKTGFETLFGPSIAFDGEAPEREDYAQIVLRGRLEKSIKSINRNLPDSCVIEVIKKVQSFSSPDLIVNNEQFHKYLFDGVGVEYKKPNGEIKHDIVRIIDFDNIENNNFLAVNQFKIIENRENRRPDIVIFINGLPMVIIELKNPENPTADIQGAFDQLQTYKQLIPSIFQYNELLIISDGIESRAGTITSDWERFMPWKTIDGEKIIGEHEPQMKVMIEGMLNKRVLLDLIHHFVVFEKTKSATLKKVAAYHQYYAVNKAIECTMRAMGLRYAPSAPSSPALLPGGEGGEFSALNPRPKGEDIESFMVAEKNYRGGFFFSGLIKEARELRKKQTKAEEFLWNIIRNKQFMGLKFRRQHQIGKYIVDFYCDEKKLIIELDGEVHNSEKQKKHDKTRDKYLTTLGNKVMRFANDRIFDDAEAVLGEIEASLSPWEREHKGEGNADHRIGVIWHTQGSGKSLSMVFYAGKIVNLLNNPTIVMLTDRNDLDDQLFGTFGNCKDTLRQTPVQAADREDLKEKLKVASGGIVFTTIQKFFPEKGEKYPMLSDRSNIIVMADEAHRSQYDFIDGLARNMRDALPNASFMGFTGTPIEKKDKNTKAVFGDYIDIYDIEQAVKDGATVKIYYESRIAKIKLKEDAKPHVDPQFEEVTEGEEIEFKEKLKSKWARVEALVGASERVGQIVKDFIEHVEKRFAAFDGKAMFVCMSRRICIDVYNEIKRLRPDWCDDSDDKGIVKVIMTGSASDPVDWQKHVRTKIRRKELADKMKDPADKLRIAIVRDMWLTGFDAPCLSTMYIDKPMQGHGLMQAIARVNRVFKDKKGGMIVDYIGIADSLKNALADYTEGDKKNIQLDTQEAVYAFVREFETVQDMFHGFDYQKRLALTSVEDRLRLQIEGAAFIAKNDKKDDFRGHVMRLSQAYALVPTCGEAIKATPDIAYFQQVKIRLDKLRDTTKKDRNEIDTAVKQIVSSAVSAGEVVDVFSAVGLKKPDISIFSDEFLAEIRGMEYKSLAAELLRKLLSDEIKKYKRTNLVKARSFMEMLEAAVIKMQKKAIETAEVIEELIKLAKEMQKAQARGVELGLNEKEEAFYDAISTNESAVREMKDDVLKQIARELVKTVKDNAKVDWNIRENVRAQMRVAVKRLLRKYDYPPDAQDAATEIVLEQAALLGEEMVG